MDKYNNFSVWIVVVRQDTDHDKEYPNHFERMLPYFFWNKQDAENYCIQSNEDHYCYENCTAYPVEVHNKEAWYKICDERRKNKA